MDGDIIIKGVGGLYTVMSPDGSRCECRARGALRKLEPPPAPGDMVTVENKVITEVKERKNILIRPFIANIDRLFIVIAVADPDPDDYYIDKLTVIAEHFAIEPVLIFNKCDLPDKNGIIDNYSGTSYKKISVCAHTGEGINELSKEFSGRISAFAGLSGVGKSSIVNALSLSSGGSGLSETGDLSERLSRGKHTTRFTELFQLCGGLVADTPGFGSIELEYFDVFQRDNLINCFPDLAEAAVDCRFADCRHVKENGCNLREAVADRRVSARRYASYIRLYDEIGEFKPWESKITLR